MSMPTPTPSTDRGDHPPAGPHLSGPAGWVLLLALLKLTLLGIVLYLVRLSEAAT